MTKKDFNLYLHIVKHYEELTNELNEIGDNFKIFDSNLIYQKAIKMDLLQIGELFNSLSDEVKKEFNNRDIRGIIDIRNYIAHGYIVLDNNNIWRDIHNDLPSLVNKLKLLFK